jgi:hypothetical protein
MTNVTIKRTGKFYRYKKSGRFAQKPSLTPAIIFMLMIILQFVYAAFSLN